MLPTVNPLLHFSSSLSPSLLPSLLCSLCHSLLLHPVLCLGPCNSCFCRSCAMTYKEAHTNCPFSSTICNNIQFKFTHIKSPKIEFICPYGGEECEGINLHEGFVKHMSECQIMPGEMGRRAKLRELNLCSEGHRLLLTSSSSNPTKLNCSICHSLSLSRHYCPTCLTHFCITCRPIRCSKTQPPLSLNYVRHTSILEIRQRICDMCGNKPQFEGSEQYGVWRDVEAGVDVCDYCYWLLGEKMGENVYSREKECIVEGHKLELLEKTVKKKCNYCYNTRDSLKHCPKCKQYYCLICKPISLLQQQCQNNHTFLLIKTDQKTKHTPCMLCTKPLSSSSQYYMYDKICSLLVCNKCFEAEKKKEMDRGQIRGYQKCDNGKHRFRQENGKKRVVNECYDCERLLEIKYLCIECEKTGEKKTMVCFRCEPPSTRDQCLMGHEMVAINEKGKKIGKVCNLCERYSKEGKRCIECEYFICETCLKRGKNM